MLIFGKQVKIKEVNDLEKNFGVYAQFHYDTWEIHVDKKAHESKHELDATLMHEVLHAIFLRCGFKQSIGHQLEEVIVECVSRAIVENFDFKVKKSVDK